MFPFQNKSPAMVDFLSKTFPEMVEKVKQGMCPCCGKDPLALGFVDALSAKEYTISGMCQSCQDDIFCAEEDIDTEEGPVKRGYPKTEYQTVSRDTPPDTSEDIAF